MFGIRFIEKSDECPTGRIMCEIFEEASWLYNENELPFKFEIIQGENLIWSTELYPNMWASWNNLQEDNFIAVIKNNDDKIISQFNHDIWVSVAVEDDKWFYGIKKIFNQYGVISNEIPYNSPQEAYSAAFDYIKDNNLI